MIYTCFMKPRLLLSVFFTQIEMVIWLVIADFVLLSHIQLFVHCVFIILN